MADTEMTPRLQLHWVPVVDARGRTHMEMRWLAPATPEPRDAGPHVTHAA